MLGRSSRRTLQQLQKRWVPGLHSYQVEAPAVFAACCNACGQVQWQSAVCDPRLLLSSGNRCGCSLERGYAAAPAQQAAPQAQAGERTHWGGLQDKDRIFTNLYGRHDPFLKVRSSPQGTVHCAVLSAWPLANPLQRSSFFMLQEGSCTPSWTMCSRGADVMPGRCLGHAPALRCLSPVGLQA